MPSLKYSLPLVASIVLSLVIGAAGGAWYQEKSNAKVIADRDAQILTLQAQFSAMGSARTDASAPTPDDVPSVSIPQRPSITVLLPKKDDRLCRGEIYTFAWQADTKYVDEVRISINAPFPAAPIADVPVTYNESGIRGDGSIEWRVGSANSGMPQLSNLPDGDLYRIQIDALNKGSTIYSLNSGTFAIDTCQG